MGFWNTLFGTGEQELQSQKINRTEHAPNITAGTDAAVAAGRDLLGGIDSKSAATGASSLQTAGFKGFEDFLSGGGSKALTDEAIGLTRQYATAPGGQIDTNRVIDTDWKDYQNASVQEVLRDVFNEMNLDADRAYRDSDSRVERGTSGYGDAQAEVARREILKELTRSKGRVGSEFLMKAFQDAMKHATADENRNVAVQGQNVALDEQALGRMFKGGQALTDTELNPLLKSLQAVLGAGAQQQGVDRQMKEDDIANLLRVFGSKQGGLQSLMAALRGPSNTTVTQEQYGQDTGYSDLIGAALGATTDAAADLGKAYIGKA
jgi:hypothetical protein